MYKSAFCRGIFSNCNCNYTSLISPVLHFASFFPMLISLVLMNTPVRVSRTFLWKLTQLLFSFSPSLQYFPLLAPQCNVCVCHHLSCPVCMHTVCGNEREQQTQCPASLPWLPVAMVTVCKGEQQKVMSYPLTCLE